MTWGLGDISSENYCAYNSQNPTSANYEPDWGSAVETSPPPWDLGRGTPCEAAFYKCRKPLSVGGFGRRWLMSAQSTTTTRVTGGEWDLGTWWAANRPPALLLPLSRVWSTLSRTECSGFHFSAAQNTHTDRLPGSAPPRNLEPGPPHLTLRHPDPSSAQSQPHTWRSPHTSNCSHVIRWVAANKVP